MDKKERYKGFLAYFSQRSLRTRVGIILLATKCAFSRRQKKPIFVSIQTSGGIVSEIQI